MSSKLTALTSAGAEREHEPDQPRRPRPRQAEHHPEHE
jgi:hypothetical protein